MILYRFISPRSIILHKTLHATLHALPLSSFFLDTEWQPHFDTRHTHVIRYNTETKRLLWKEITVDDVRWWTRNETHVLHAVLKWLLLHDAQDDVDMWMKRMNHRYIF